GAGGGSDLVAERKDRFLMGNGDIATGKFAAAQPLEKGRKVCGRHINGFIAAINAVFGEPGAVNQGRAGMGNGMPDNKGFDGHEWAWGDRSSGAISRRAARSGSRGRPRMVK